MPKVLADAILSYSNEVDLPTDNDVATAGRLAFVEDTRKVYRDDGTNWVDPDLSGSMSLVRLNAIREPNAPLDLNAQRITDLADPTGAQDAATKAYADAKRLNENDVPDGDVIMDGFKLSDLGDPTAAQDAATKAYVDAAAGGGSGLPVGGTTGQVLTKQSGTDGDADWAAPSGGGGGGGGGSLPNPMLAAGDLIIGQASGLTDHALAAAGSTATTIGMGTANATNAIDGSDATKAASSLITMTGQGIRIDLGSAKLVEQFRVYQPDTANSAFGYTIESSDDDATLDDAAYGDRDAPDSAAVTLDDPATARYWRVVVTTPSTGNGGNGWNVATITLASGTPPGYPMRLAPGTEARY